RNFSWVVPNVLAGLSIPRQAEDIQALKSLGVSLVCTVVGESPLPRAWFNTANNSGDSSSNNSIRNVFWNVQNYMPPTVKQVDEFMAAVEAELSQPASDGEPPRACLVHCGGGKGRAGTFLACYLAKYGPYPIDFAAQAQGPFMSSSEAVALIRQMRPGSIETHEQEAFVREY
ncbi:phosphatases II, partial [Ramicandelaber brevisporus]